MAYRFETMEEIEGLEGYVPEVKRGEQQFSELLGYYQFRDKVRCGRADCHQPHGFGYVVRTVAGAVTGIGNKCGRDEFGDVFTAAESAFVEQRRRMRVEKSLAKRVAEMDAIRAQAQAWIDAPRGGRWLDRAKASLKDACPPNVIRRLYGEVLDRGGVIVRTRMRGPNDPPAPKWSPGQPPSSFIDERIATLRGVRGLGSPSPRQMLETQVLGPLKMALADVSLEKLLADKSLLAQFDSWHRGSVGVFRDAEQRLTEAVLFFETDNLHKLEHLASTPDEQKRVRQLAFNDSTGLVEVVPLAA